MKTMYQVKHKEFGIFQGIYGPSLYWLNVSLTPILGIAKFESEDEAKQFISDVCQTFGVNKEEFSIAPFDEDLHEKLCAHSSIQIGVC